MGKRKHHKGPVNAKGIKFDGVSFKSGLERYTYMQLKKAKLFEGYENEKFQLIEGFTFINESWEHQGNGKGDFTDRGSGKRILGISYTPDFTGKDFVIECKGRPNAAFPIRWKLFKQWMTNMGDSRPCYMPKNQKDVDKMILIIKQRRRDERF